MSCRSEPSNPNSGCDANVFVDEIIQSCPIQPEECPQVEIEINNTPATDDDLVQLKCTLPAKRHRVACRIRAVSGSSVSGMIVLTNPDGRLRFPDDGDITKTLAVAPDGAWVAFEISGETGSNALNDAVIEAHCKTPTGALKGSKTVTVFWFDEVKMDVTVSGNYSLIGNNYGPSPVPAANLSAEARIRPAGVNCAARQVNILRVGIIQNAFPPLQRIINWGNPTIRWNTGVPKGAKVSVQIICRQSMNIGVPCQDSSSLSNPLYDQPGNTGEVGGTIDENSIKEPKGCPGGGAATSSDSPSHQIPLTRKFPALSLAGIPLGEVTYTFVNYSQRDNFRTWAVIFNSIDNTFCPLRERVWKTNLNSSAAGAQRATIEPDSEPTVEPITALPFYNDRIRDPRSWTEGFFGASIIFTKP